MYKRVVYCKTVKLIRRSYCIGSNKLTKVFEDDGVKYITMCNKKTRNALSLSMLNELYTHIVECNDNLRSIVISADGHVFSAGHDLKELTKDKGADVHRNIFNTCTKLMNAILESPVPVIAAVNGVATAAGCQLVATCDIAICTERSSFALPGGNIGIFCSTPGISVSRKIPKTVLAHMLFTGLPLSSSEALRHGLVCKVVPTEDQLENEIKIITDAIKSKSRSVVQLGKKFFYTQMELNLKTAYEYGENIMVYNISLKDGQEGINSFLNKRRPNWTNTLDSDMGN